MGHTTENVELTVLCLIQNGSIVSSDEGNVEWIELDKLSEINTVSDFQDLMKVFNDPELNEFQYIVEGDNWIINLK